MLPSAYCVAISTTAARGAITLASAPERLSKATVTSNAQTIGKNFFMSFYCSDLGEKQVSILATALRERLIKRGVPVTEVAAYWWRSDLPFYIPALLFRVEVEAKVWKVAFELPPSRYLLRESFDKFVDETAARFIPPAPWWQSEWFRIWERLARKEIQS
jgi:hypothetical protein